jgi:hypothetical protein
MMSATAFIAYPIGEACDDASSCGTEKEKPEQFADLNVLQSSGTVFVA